MGSYDGNEPTKWSDLSSSDFKPSPSWPGIFRSWTHVANVKSMDVDCLLIFKNVSLEN